jgi:flagellar motor switch/type III secretory pathway protein FliN
VAGDRTTPPDPFRKPPPRPRLTTIRANPPPPRTSHDDARQAREDEEATSREGRLLVELSEARERAEEAERELTRERRKSRPEPDSEPPRARDLERLEAKFDAELANVARQVSELRASQRSETIKILVGAVVSIILAVIGNRALTPPPPQPVIQRSKYDRDLDACAHGEFESDQARERCFDAAFRERPVPAM